MSSGEKGKKRGTTLASIDLLASSTVFANLVGSWLSETFPKYLISKGVERCMALVEKSRWPDNFDVDSWCCGTWTREKRSFDCQEVRPACQGTRQTGVVGESGAVHRGFRNTNTHCVTLSRARTALLSQVTKSTSKIFTHSSLYLKIGASTNKSRTGHTQIATLVTENINTLQKIEGERNPAPSYQAQSILLLSMSRKDH